MQNKPTQEYNGCKFIFACKHSDTNNWIIIQRRFILHNPEPKKLIGQFITSNWWKLQCNLNSNVTLLIIKAKADENISEIEMELNCFSHESFGGGLPWVCLGDDAWLFYIDENFINTLIKKTTEDHLIELRSMAHSAVLKLKIIPNKEKGCIYLITPSFTIDMV